MRKSRNLARRVFGLTLSLLSLISAAALVPGSTAIASADAISPWSYTGNLNTARAGHTATLLPAGQVLVAGGSTVDGFYGNAENAQNSAELYDPAIGTWSVTGSLSVPRLFHTATLLSNGKVLVAGGLTKIADLGIPPNYRYSTISDAELYDPATGSWSVTGSLSADRYGHTATLLPDGKVLVAGGLSFGPNGTAYCPRDAELYDPAKGKWSLTGSLNAGRFLHTATPLRDGKVLVAGGTDEDWFDDVLYSAELYDPNTGTWSGTGSLKTAREEHTATILPNGNILAAGGWGEWGVDNSAELYDAATGMWTIIGNLNVARLEHTTTLLEDGKVLFAGGIGLHSTLNSAELYDPVTGKLTGAVNLNVPRHFHTATLLLNGRLLIVGGSDDTHRSLQSVELYDPNTPIPNTPIPTPKIIGASVEGKSLIVVGENFDSGAVILINGEEQKTTNDSQNAQTALIAKRAGNKIQPGDKLQVRNPSGTLSGEFTFTGS